MFCCFSIMFHSDVLLHEYLSKFCCVSIMLFHYKCSVVSDLAGPKCLVEGQFIQPFFPAPVGRTPYHYRYTELSRSTRVRVGLPCRYSHSPSTCISVIITCHSQTNTDSPFQLTQSDQRHTDYSDSPFQLTQSDQRHTDYTDTFQLTQ